MKTKKEKLIPPDLARCQTDKPNGHTFMTLGGVPGYVRCENKPTHIAYEPKRADGRPSGSMSVCGDCLPRCANAVPGVRFQEIRTVRAVQKGASP